MELSIQLSIYLWAQVKELKTGSLLKLSTGIMALDDILSMIL